MTVQWHREHKLNVLAIYAPNQPARNEKFWKEVLQIWQEENLPKSDMILGDHNMVEDSVDRLPSHADNANTVDALNEVKHKFQLQDGWRHTNPHTKAYTFLQQYTSSQSCIDRIYVSGTVLKNSFDWEIETPGISTDHKIVSMRMTIPQVPFIGKGRWTIPLYLLRNKWLLSEIHSLGIKLEKDLEAVKVERSQISNPQLLFKTFKEAVAMKARHLAKTATL